MPRDTQQLLDAPAVSEEAAIVRRMMELLKEPENWCQGALEDDGRMCVLGAVHNVSVERHVSGLPLEVLRSLTQECGRGGVDAWNDAPGRTHAEVLAMLARVLRRFEGV